ncbi:MAG TPA: AAA family ATPase, partial [Chroococcidiopsis sp.]
MSNPFIPTALISRRVELQHISQILQQDGDFLVVGAPGTGRHTLIRAAAQQVGARMIEIDCLRSTSANRFLRLLADGFTEAFPQPKELARIEEWSGDHALFLEHLGANHRPRLTWQAAAGKEWGLFQTLLALPQRMAEWLDCRVVIVFQNFPHIRSWDRSGKWEHYLRQEVQRQSRVSYALVTTVAEPWVQDSHHLQVIPLAPLDNSDLEPWIVAAMTEVGFEFDRESQALAA